MIPTTHDEWLKVRLAGIGASEASAIIGLNPYMSNLELWKLKTGRKQAVDISSNAHVKYGHEAEQHIRSLFALDYAKRYEVQYGGAFDMVHNQEYHWLFATLDGRLIERETGRKGILEIKTCEVSSKIAREKWRDSIPDNYYVQILHQLLATGFEFAVLHAQLKNVWGDEIKTTRQSYFIERSEVEDDLKFLLEKEVDFWTKYVQKDIEPPVILPAI